MLVYPVSNSEWFPNHELFGIYKYKNIVNGSK